MKNLSLKNNYGKSQGGFTYIELLIYMVICTIMLNTLVPFAWNVIETGAKSATQQELSSNARFASEIIKYEIRNASGFNVGTSVFGTNPGTLSLIDFTAGNNPTIFNVASGKLMMKQGAGAAVQITSNDVTVTNLTFTNYTSGAISENIQFLLTLTSNTTSTRQEYQGTITLQGAAEIRSN